MLGKSGWCGRRTAGSAGLATSSLAAELLWTWRVRRTSPTGVLTAVVKGSPARAPFERAPLYVATLSRLPPGPHGARRSPVLPALSAPLRERQIHPGQDENCSIVRRFRQFDARPDQHRRVDPRLQAEGALFAA